MADGLARDPVLAALAVVFAKVVALVHAAEIRRIVQRHGAEAGLAFAAVGVGAGLEEAHSVGRADGLVGGIAARIGAFRLERRSGQFGRRVGRARQTTRLLGVGLISSDRADDASVVLGQSRARLTFGLGTLVRAGRARPRSGETDRAGLAGHFASFGSIGALGAGLAGGVVG